MIGPHHHHSERDDGRTTWDHAESADCLVMASLWGPPCWCPQGHPYDQLFNQKIPLEFELVGDE